jgi:hypothetical protein
MTTWTATKFVDDIKKGHIGEDIFITDFLTFLNIKYENVTGRQGFQLIDADILAKIGLYEIKTNYKDNKILIIEEFTNVNTNLGKLSTGWFYKSKADTIVFISKATRAMILVPFTALFKAYYETIKERFELIPNAMSTNKGSMWQSAFRKIPLEAINGYFAFYKKVG